MMRPGMLLPILAMATWMAVACADTDGAQETVFSIPQLVDTIGPKLLVTAIDPISGSVDGETKVTVLGEGFEPGSTLTIGGADAGSTFESSSTIFGATGPHPLGMVDVVVTNESGDSGTLIAGFTYVEPRRSVESTIRFKDVAAGAGVAFQHTRDDFPTPFGGGTAVGDYNGDGLLDIYVTNSAGPNALYRNNGDETFIDVASAAGVEDAAGHGHGAGWGDYDNDGHLDLFVANFGSSKLFHNDGDGAFSDVTAAAGVADPDDSYRTTGVAWGDYDQDGHLDLLVVRHFSEHDPSAYETGDYSKIARPLALYRNNGDGTFANVTYLLGDPNDHKSNVNGAGFKPGFIDYDNDGDADIYVVNDFGEAHHPNVLWRNDGPDVQNGWTFTDVSRPSGADAAMFGMSLAIGDYDNDGNFDFYITNMGDSVFLRSRGNGAFVNVAEQTGTGRGSIPENGLVDMSIGWGAVFADFDNDGLLDLYYTAGYLDVDASFNLPYQPNAVYMNRGDGTFADVSDQSGADDPGFGRGVASADFNNDGLIDLYLVNLGKLDGTPGTARMFKNISDNTNNWLIIKTVGTSSNRDGIGARISVVADGVTRIREMGASQGHYSQSVVPVHFGLGLSTQVDTIAIRWPSGKVQTLTDVVVNQVLTVTEPD